jgi:hypothetical protein
VEARGAVLVAIGTVPWLVLAGFMEGFISRTGTTWIPALVIGVIVGGGYWFLVWYLGVRRPHERGADGWSSQPGPILGS